MISTSFSYSKSKITAGPDACTKLLGEASKKRLLSAQSIERAGLAWGVGPDGSGQKLRDAYKSILEQTKNAGGTENDAVLNYLRIHAYTSADQLSYYHLPPEVRTRNEMLRIQDIVTDAPVERIVTERALQTSRTPDQEKDRSVVLVLEHLNNGGTLREDDLKALEWLRSRVLELGVKADRLRSLISPSGQADYVTWMYLKANQHAFTKKITESKDGENLYISYPQIGSNGEPFVQVRKIRDIDDLESFLSEFERKGAVARDYKKELQNYATDYLIYRHLANRLKSIKDSKVNFYLESPSKTEEQKLQEEKNKSKFEELNAEIEYGIGRNRMIHPHPSLLPDSYSWLHVKSLLSTGDRNWRTLTSFFVTLVLIPINLYVVFDTRIKETLIVSALDEKNALDEEYWIQKCSQEDTYQKIKDCLARWGEVASNVLLKRAEQKQSLDRNYFPMDEIALIGQLNEKIVFGTINRAGFKAMGELQTSLDQKYLIEKIYSHYESQRKQTQMEQEVEKTASKTSEVSHTQTSDKSSTPQKVKEHVVANKTFLVGRLDELQKEIISASAKMNSEFETFKDKPEERVKSLWSFARKMTELMVELEGYEGLPLGDSVNSKVELLEQKISEELEAANVKLMSLVGTSREVVVPARGGVLAPDQLPKGNTKPVVAPSDDKAPAPRVTREPSSYGFRSPNSFELKRSGQNWVQPLQ